MSTDLKCRSLNVRGLNSYEKRIVLFDWLRDAEYDVICLQETHFIKSREFVYNFRWNGKIVHNFSDSPHSRDVSILFKNGIDITIENEHRSEDGRILLINITYKEKHYTFVNIYAHNNDNQRVAFFEKVKNWILKYSVNLENVCLCGDFYCCLDRETKDKSATKLSKIIKQLNLCDIFRKFNNDMSGSHGYTWCN